MKQTTLEDIEALPEEILYPKHVKEYLHTSENTISNAANKGLLPWAYKLGSRTAIPKKAFVNYHRYGQITNGNLELRRIKPVEE